MKEHKLDCFLIASSMIGLVLVVLMVVAGCRNQPETSMTPELQAPCIKYMKQDGLCYGFIVSETSNLHNVVSFTHVPDVMCVNAGIR